VSNLSNQIVKIGHKLHEINMTLPAKGEFVIDEAHQMIQVKVMEGLNTVYWEFIFLNEGWAEADARKVELDVEQCERAGQICKQHSEATQ